MRDFKERCPFSEPSALITPLNEIPFSLHKLVSDLPHVMITGTGHWLHMDKPGEFNQILDNFLRSLDHDKGS